MDIKKFKTIINTIYKIDNKARIQSEVIHSDGRIVEITFLRKLIEEEQQILRSFDIKDYASKEDMKDIGLTDYEIEELARFNPRATMWFFYT